MLYFLKRQIVRAAISAADMDQFNPRGGLRNKLPVFIQVFKVIGQVEQDVEVEVFRAVIPAIAIRNIPGAGMGLRAIGCRQRPVGGECKRIAVEMLGLIFSGVNKGSDLPSSGLDIILDHRLRGIGRVTIGAGE